MDKEHILRIGLIESQPITAEGVRHILNDDGRFELSWAVTSLEAGAEQARQEPPRILLVDKTLGMQAIVDFISTWSSSPSHAPTVVWGISMTEAEALRLLHCGAKGVLAKSSPVPTFAACLDAVAGGLSWVEQSILTGRDRQAGPLRNALTDRELQVKELVEQGYRNWEIARELGIRAGTVKIHLKHIFEKTGVRGRHSLALAGIRERQPLDGIAGAGWVTRH